MSDSTLVLRDFRPLNRNTLRGFATVLIAPGLVIKDIAVHTKNNRSWAQLPSKPLIADGLVKKDDAGKPVYVPILEWENRDLSERFSAAVVKAVEAKHPDTFA